MKGHGVNGVGVKGTRARETRRRTPKTNLILVECTEERQIPRQFECPGRDTDRVEVGKDDLEHVRALLEINRRQLRALSGVARGFEHVGEHVTRHAQV